MISAKARRNGARAAHPDTEPTKSLLGRWSQEKGLGLTAAALLTELNRRIEDPDFRIGPSYLMKSDAPDAHSPERLDRIWRTSILPLLQEHHYGEWDSIKRRYQLKSLLAAISGAGEALPESPGAVEGREPAAEADEVGDAVAPASVSPDVGE